METYFDTLEKGLELIDNAVKKGYLYNGGGNIVWSIDDVKADVRRIFRPPIMSSYEPVVKKWYFIYGIYENEKEKTFYLFSKSVKHED